MNSWLDFLRLDYFIYLVYFFIPANIFIYGVNDYWDKETDRKNPKKNEKEQRVTKENEKRLLWLLYVVFGISLVLLLFQSNMVERVLFSSFLFLSYFYSAKPLRFKAIPIVDFASNILYIIPGIFGYYLVAKSLPPILYVVAGFTHIAAMHLFSAIPDIKYDKEANITTTAVLLGKKATLVLCLTFWSLLAALVVFLSSFHPFSFFVLIYPTVPATLLGNENSDIEKVYWTFPYINTFLGGFLFVMIVLSTIN